MQSLNDKISNAFELGLISRDVPEHVVLNLNPKFVLRAYQLEAFTRFAFYWKKYPQRSKPCQLLFHMATGSGKTIIMAGLIVYLYEKGYRNFLFFVNSSNIINKTRDNFLNSLSSKYLFSENISIGNKKIAIKEVQNFQGVNSEDINIVFSTIQGLHSNLNSPRENCITYEDFEDKKIVLISDEAHHINAETKRGNELEKEEREEIVTWEGTVSRIFNSNSDNVLLEFTATADLSVPEIQNKYVDKLVFDYPLRQFRKDGYSKEVKVLEADLPAFERALQGLLLSQYRRKVFEKHKKFVKPVILLKSKTIKESLVFQEDFVSRIKALDVLQIEKLKTSSSDDAISKVFRYLDKNNITLENLVIELKEDFSEDKLISVNSKDESEQKQLAINSLEDEDNEFRAVFAVDKLNEGWDVLNLFDIVRLYDTRDAKEGRPGKTTMSEAQLIGRGARYFPFQVSSDQPLFGRKYDDDIENELRICEELYYHSAYNPRYIQELNKALEEIGIKPKDSIERTVKIKSEFRNTSFFQTAMIFLNEQEKYENENEHGLSQSSISRVYKKTLKTGISKSSFAFEEQTVLLVDNQDKEFRLLDFGENIIRKALNKLDFFQFNHLKKLRPKLTSITEFITSPDYLGSIKVQIQGLPKQLANLSPDEKLDTVISVLENISTDLASNTVEYKGSKKFRPFMLKDKIDDKTLNFSLSDSEDKEFGRSMINPVETKYPLDLSKRDWYVFDDCFGTGEEKKLVKYIDKVYGKLKFKYDEIYLVRNERFFKIFNFDDERALEPDFVLFLIKKELNLSMHYQVFIEPKGDHLIKTDEWKEKFLISLKDEHKLDQLWKGRTYVVWGMPFYNEAFRKSEFDTTFNQVTDQ
jgi:type III restriction enzyme